MQVGVASGLLAGKDLDGNGAVGGDAVAESSVVFSPGVNMAVVVKREAMVPAGGDTDDIFKVAGCRVLLAVVDPRIRYD